MNILSISLEESSITRTELFDWLVSPEVKGGIMTEKYWLINTTTQFHNPQGDHEIEKLRALLYSCLVNKNNYQILIIRK